MAEKETQRRRERFIGAVLGGEIGHVLSGGCADGSSVALCVAESLISQKKYCPEDIARRVAAWRRKTEEKKSTGNPMTICVPLSLMYCREEDVLIPATQEVFAITGRYVERYVESELSELSCIFINLIIARLLLGDKKKDACAYAVGKIGGIDHDTVRAATSVFITARSFEETVVKVPGAVSGALAGAYFGRPGIPRRLSGIIGPLSTRHLTCLGERLFETTTRSDLV